MIRKNKKALATSLALMHQSKIEELWYTFKNSECLKAMQNADLISDDEAFEIAAEAMQLALYIIPND